MKYTIAHVGASAEIDGKYGTQIRTAFKVEGDERQLSAFTKYPLIAGQEVDGEIVTVEKEGRSFHNFKFGSKASVGAPQVDGLRLERKVDALMTELQMMRTVLGDILSKVDKVDTSSPF